MAQITPDHHDKTIGWLHIINGVGSGLLAGFLWVMIRALPRLLELADQELDAQQLQAIEIVLSISGWMIAAVIVVCVLEALAGAAWLAAPNETTRVLLIVTSAIQLLNPPIGTAIGGYALWVLLRQRAASEVPSTRSETIT